MSDLNYPCSHWHKWKKKVSDSVRLNRIAFLKSLHRQAAAVVHLCVGFMSAIHPVFRSVISFPFGKFPEHGKETASTDREKRYLLICRKHFCSLIAKSLKKRKLLLNKAQELAVKDEEQWNLPRGLVSYWNFVRVLLFIIDTLNFLLFKRHDLQVQIFYFTYLMDDLSFLFMYFTGIN